MNPEEGWYQNTGYGWKVLRQMFEPLLAHPPWIALLRSTPAALPECLPLPGCITPLLSCPSHPPRKCNPSPPATRCHLLPPSTFESFLLRSLSLTSALRCPFRLFLHFPRSFSSYGWHERVPSWFSAVIQSLLAIQEHWHFSRPKCMRHDEAQTRLPSFSAPTNSGWESGREKRPISEVVIKAAATPLCECWVRTWTGEQISQEGKQMTVLSESLRSLVGVSGRYETLLCTEAQS